MARPCPQSAHWNYALTNAPRNALPIAVDNLFTRTPPVRDVLCLALGPAQSYYFGYIDVDGKAYQINQNLPLGLSQWLATDSQGFVNHDIRSTTVTLGADGSYVVKDKSKMAWSGVPDAAAQRLQTAGIPRLISLGMDRSFVIVNADGSGYRDLRGRYPALETSLAALPSLNTVQVSQSVWWRNILRPVAHKNPVCGNLRFQLRFCRWSDR